MTPSITALNIKYNKDKETGTINLSQPFLIRKIIHATRLQEGNPNWTPTSVEALGMDPDGEPMQEEWNYRSIVGMLLYLSTNTRPDISFCSKPSCTIFEYTQEIQCLKYHPECHPECQDQWNMVRNHKVLV